MTPADRPPPGTPVTILPTGRTGTITGHLQDPYGGTYAVNVDGQRRWHRGRELRAETGPTATERRPG